MYHHKVPHYIISECLESDEEEFPSRFVAEQLEDLHPQSSLYMDVQPDHHVTEVNKYFQKWFKEIPEVEDLIRDKRKFHLHDTDIRLFQHLHIQLI